MTVIKSGVRMESGNQVKVAFPFSYKVGEGLGMRFDNLSLF
jgi:hypothetical protein